MFRPGLVVISCSNNKFSPWQTNKKKNLKDRSLKLALLALIIKCSCFTCILIRLNRACLRLSVLVTLSRWWASVLLIWCCFPSKMEPSWYLGFLASVKTNSVFILFSKTWNNQFNLAQIVNIHTDYFHLCLHCQRKRSTQPLWKWQQHINHPPNLTMQELSMHSFDLWVELGFSV